MKLKLALQADIGDVLATEGTTGYIGVPKNRTGEHNGKPYSFWTQFVTIADGEDSIGANLSFESKDACLVNKGDHIKVKGTLESYVDKDGKTKLSIGRAKVTEKVAGTQGKAQGGSKGGDSRSDADKNRSFALSYAKDLIVGGCASMAEWEALANRGLDYLNNKPAAQSPAPPLGATGNEEPAPTDDDIPF